MPPPVRELPQARFALAELVIIVLGIVASALAFHWVRESDLRQTRHDFEQAAQLDVAALRIALDRGFESVESAGTVFDVSDHVTRAEFALFARRALGRNPGLKAVAWMPLVEERDRINFEAAQAKERPGFRIAQLDARYQLVPAAHRERYFPIAYSEDRDGVSPFGMDVLAIPDRRDLMALSVASDRTVMSSRMRLVTGASEGKLGVTLLRPVYRHDVQTGTGEQRAAALAGFASSIISLGNQIDDVLDRVGTRGVRLVLYDESAPPAQRFLAVWPDGAQEDPATRPGAREPAMKMSVPVDVGGRKWIAEATPLFGFFVPRNAGYAWFTLLAGIGFSLLIVGYMESMRRYAAMASRQAVVDLLTGLYNRRYLDEFLQGELIRAERKNTPLAVMMIDIDFFKRVNDTFGHPAGDQVLMALGALFKASVRGSDVACRYGGEEFLLVLPESLPGIVQQRAEEIRTAVKRLDLSHQGRPLGVITVSIGVAIFPSHALTTEELLRKADEALYEAKRTGRDRVAIAGAKQGVDRRELAPA